jgi:hypothetical protein
MIIDEFAINRIKLNRRKNFRQTSPWLIVLKDSKRFDRLYGNSGDGTTQAFDKFLLCGIPQIFSKKIKQL